jgi:hypothetical protein
MVRQAIQQEGRPRWMPHRLKMRGIVLHDQCIRITNSMKSALVKPDKKFHVFYKTGSLSFMCARARHWNLSSARWILSSPRHHISFRSTHGHILEILNALNFMQITSSWTSESDTCRQGARCHQEWLGRVQWVFTSVCAQTPPGELTELWSLLDGGCSVTCVYTALSAMFWYSCSHLWC